MKRIRIDDNIYGNGFTLITACTPREYRAYMKKRFDIDNDDIYITGEYSQVFHEEKNKKYIIIFVENNDVVTLVHELMHHVHNTMVDKGVSYREEENEVEAHYMDYILQKVLDKLNKKPREKSKGEKARTYVKATKDRKRSGNSKKKKS